MKKISILLVAGIGMVAALQLTSCKKDSGSTATLVGTWASKTMHYKITNSGIVTIDTTEAFTDFELTMKADKTYNLIDVTDTSNNDNGTYATSGSKMYLTNKDGLIDTMDYTLTSTDLSVKNTTTNPTAGTIENTINFTKK